MRSFRFRSQFKSTVSPLGTRNVTPAAVLLVVVRRKRVPRLTARDAAGTGRGRWWFFFFCVRCDDCAKSSGRWLLGSPPSAVVRQLAPRAWCPLQCLLAKTVGVLSPGVGRSEECAQGFAPQSHIHSGLNQQDLVSLDVFLAHSDQYVDGRWWFGSSCQGC